MTRTNKLHWEIKKTKSTFHIFYYHIILFIDNSNTSNTTRQLYNILNFNHLMDSATKKMCHLKLQYKLKKSLQNLTGWAKATKQTWHVAMGNRFE